MPRRSRSRQRRNSKVHTRPLSAPSNRRDQRTRDRAERKRGVHQRTKGPSKCTSSTIILKTTREVWVTCIRHGQSEAQTAPRRERLTETYRDPPLTRKGHIQAKDLAQKVLIPELVVCSTLTRAIQTACHLFGKKDVQIISSPIVCELGHIPENNPRPLQDLKKDSQIARLPGIDRIKFENTTNPQDSSTSSKSSSAACMEFCKWLQEREEKHITLVGHSNFIRKLSGNSLRIENCSPLHLRINQQGIELVTSKDTIKALGPNTSKEEPVVGERKQRPVPSSSPKDLRNNSKKSPKDIQSISRKSPKNLEKINTVMRERMSGRGRWIQSLIDEEHSK
ncbi:hypothetical protein AAMO2058_001645600 [Amorphochlora amoebiformis]